MGPNVKKIYIWLSLLMTITGSTNCDFNKVKKNDPTPRVEEPKGIASLTTTTVSSITKDTAVSGGTITDDGGAPITRRGVCWSTSENPTLSRSSGTTLNGTGAGSFTSTLTGLSIEEGNTFYVRAYAVSNVGISYGNEVSFSN